MRFRPQRLLALVSGIAAAGLSSPAAAQRAVLPLAPDHWSYEILEAMDVSGVADSWMVGVRPSGREPVRGELRRVVDGRFGGARWGRFTRSWLARFEEQMPLGSADDGGPARAEARVASGFRDGDAFLDPGGGVYAELAGAAAVGPVSAWATFDTGSRERFDGLREAGIGASAGPFSFTIGRQRVKAGGPAETSALLGGDVPLDGLYVVSNRPVKLPLLDWIVGRTHWHFALAPYGGIGETDGPWIGLGGAFAEPHPRFRIGATRVARFGGSDTEPVTAERLLRMFFVMQNQPTGWDDQKLDLWARLRWSFFGQPLATYVVLAQEDSPLWKNPGIQTGVVLPMLSEVGLFSARYEYTAYGQRARWCPGCEFARGPHGTRFQAQWYSHGRMGLFEREGIPLGDPLGGYGANHKLSVGYWAPGGEVRGRLWSTFAIREDGNLLMERWPHKRRSGGVDVGFWPAPGVEVEAGAQVATGPQVDSEWGVSLKVSATLPRAW